MSVGGGGRQPAPRCPTRGYTAPCPTLMAFREPLKSMLCEETSVHTGLSWARMVFTFCRFWMSHTWQGGGRKASGPSEAAGLAPQSAPARRGPTHDDGTVRGAAVQPAPVGGEPRGQGGAIRRPRRRCPARPREQPLPGPDSSERRQGCSRSLGFPVSARKPWESNPGPLPPA